jgi:DNA-binding winged helix-turn-helix (wHTH) protein/tetratricopeptide (TPR) repeat protein
MRRQRYPILSFDGLALDMKRGCLFGRDGKEVKLRPKSFGVLRYLVENSGRLVSKGELLEAVWADAAVTDDSLVQCLIDVRRALADSDQCLVKTVPRRGYIFQAEVTVGQTAAQEPDPTGDGESADTTVHAAAPAQETPALLLDPSKTADAETVVRLAVLPFRLLKADADINFLSYSLADAITSSLTGVQSLVVRSSLAAMRYGSEPLLDVRRVARELGVDLLLTGTILRVADDLRVTVELIEAATCKAAWSQVSRVTLGEMFELQDSLARRIVSALPLNPKDREQSAAHDVPRDTRAYELFLRANRYAIESNTWRLAQSLYEECLKCDPSFAPAWARLGRVRRVLGKYNPDGEYRRVQAAAEGALQRALELNPDLSAAHLYLSQLETDLGRAEESMARLLRRARGRAEPEIHAALVHTCRYCGLLDASIAAHDLTMRLDPATETSVLHTYFAMGRYEHALETGARSADTLDCIVLSLLGRLADARAAAVREEERFASHPVKRTVYSAVRALLENRCDDARALLARRAASHNMDGEAIYHTMRLRAFLGDRDEALDLLERSIAQGYFCTPLFDRDPWLASVRGDARFIELMRQARERHAGRGLIARTALRCWALPWSGRFRFWGRFAGRIEPLGTKRTKSTLQN